MELQSLLIERGITLHTVKIIQNLYDSWVKNSVLNMEYITIWEKAVKFIKMLNNIKRWDYI